MKGKKKFEKPEMKVVKLKQIILDASSICPCDDGCADIDGA